MKLSVIRSISTLVARVGLGLLLAGGVGVGLHATWVAAAEGSAPRISDGNVPMATGYGREEVLDGLNRPWAMAWLPDGRMLITERPGQLRLVKDGKLQPTAIAGLPPVLAVRQGGLLDVAVDPDFAENGLIYLSYAHGTEEANHLRVLRAKLAGSTLTDAKVIFESNRDKPGGQHFGSRFLWLADDTLLISIGDGGNPPVKLGGEWIRNQAQNRASGLGTVVRIDRDGNAPDDNPFVGDKASDPRTWSYGHRNIQGMALDRATGRIWASEHGALGGDELNLLTPGTNYGWPLVTHSREYSGGEISPKRSATGMRDSHLVWQTAIAPSGLLVYSGDRFADWQGDLFAGGLVSQDVRRLEIDANGRIVNEDAIRIGARVRDVRQGPDGLIYILTDESNGRLIRLRPTNGPGPQAP
jgi:glucose/arabinose dehydrogenase